MKLKLWGSKAVKFVLWSTELQERVLAWNLNLNLKKETVCSVAMSVPAYQTVS